MPDSLLRHLSGLKSRRPKSFILIIYFRSPRHFESILNLYRTGQLHLMEGVCVQAFAEELAYWGLGKYQTIKSITLLLKNKPINILIPNTVIIPVKKF